MLRSPADGGHFCIFASGGPGPLLHARSLKAVSNRTRFAGLCRSRFLDYEPTGRPIRFPLAVVIPFRDGLMAGERFYYDLATFAQADRCPPRRCTLTIYEPVGPAPRALLRSPGPFHARIYHAAGARVVRLVRCP